MTTADKVINNLDRLFDVYGESECSCAESGCDDEGICRCGVITGLNVTLDARSIDRLDLDPLDKWFYLELIRDAHVQDETHEWVAESDYYGEELRSYTLNLTNVSNLIRATEFYTIKEKVEWLLGNQYSKLEPVNKVTRWDVETVELSKLTYSNNNHLVKCLNRNNGQRNTLELLGIVIKNGDKYHLIDGYNRVSRALAKNKTGLFVVGYNERESD